MINAQIKLITLIFDSEHGRYRILSLSDHGLDLPNIIVESNLDINNALEYLLAKYIDNQNIYHNFKLTDIDIIENILNIYFIVFVTHETAVTESFLLDINHNLLLPPNANKIIKLL